MSSTKKKLTQIELRRLMNEQKKKLQTNIKKIEHPLAKYDKDGILYCILCETVVRSENVWTVHLNSKNHKQNVLSKVQKKEPPKEKFVVPQSTVSKRPAPPEPSPSPPKKIKGILKNATPVSQQNQQCVSAEPRFSNSTLFSKQDVSNLGEKPNYSSNEKIVGNNDDDDDDDDDVPSGDTLPEGFFDDPKLDAKARNVEYRDPVEEEWERFQKEIKEETNKAQEIIAEDQEEATTERQLDEIDEQMRNWSRVLSLEQKKEKVNTTAGCQNLDKNDDELSDDGEFEEFLDWRSKKSFDYKMNNLLST